MKHVDTVTKIQLVAMIMGRVYEAVLLVTSHMTVKHVRSIHLFGSNNLTLM